VIAKTAAEGENAEATPAAEPTAEAPVAATPAEPEEPEVKGYDEYLKSLKKAEATLPKARSAGEGEDTSKWNSFKKVERTDEDSPYVVKKAAADKAAADKAAADKAAAEKKAKKVLPADKVISFSTEPQQQKKSGKQQQSRSAEPVVFDDSAFPALK